MFTCNKIKIQHSRILTLSCKPVGSHLNPYLEYLELMKQSSSEVTSSKLADPY